MVYAASFLGAYLPPSPQYSPGVIYHRSEFDECSISAEGSIMTSDNWATPVGFIRPHLSQERLSAASSSVPLGYTPADTPSFCDYRDPSSRNIQAHAVQRVPHPSLSGTHHADSLSYPSFTSETQGIRIQPFASPHQSQASDLVDNISVPASSTYASSSRSTSFSPSPSPSPPPSGVEPCTPAASTSTVKKVTRRKKEPRSVVTTEEKRRRNTEASTRFRKRRKQRTVETQHTIADLTERAKELEEKAEELRRENGWLKEILALKNTYMSGGAPGGPQ